MKELSLMSYISFRNFSHQILKCFGMRLSFDIKIQIFISKFKVRSWGIQKQPPRDVLKKRYSENM